MFITKIDDLIDRIIDDFYSTIIKNKKLEKIRDETNFIKSQKDINEFINGYVQSIPQKEIKDIVHKADSYKTIYETLKRYITTYVFLMIGIFYKGKPDVYINNLIEFTRNQAEYTLKIDNFFNAESNSQIIKLFYMCRNIMILLSKDSIKAEYIKKEPYVTETMEFLNMLNDEFIDNFFRLKGNNNNLLDQSHSIIKTIIVLLVYKIYDKKTLYTMIEQTEISEGEYMFIDIIEPITDTINFNVIESLLSKKDLFSGLAYDLWDYIEELDETKKHYVSAEEKINILINTGIIVPILDDFLLYHRDTERYDKNPVVNTSSVAKKKEDTKVRYIIGKIDTTIELYSDNAKNDAKLRNNIMKNFSPPLYNKKAILRNNMEEIKIINKFINQGKRNSENNDYFNDLVTYRRYAYVNFKDFEKYGFANHFTKTVTAVRAVSFDTTSEFKQNNLNNRIQLRVGAKDTVGNIVGFMIPSNIKAIKCINVGDVINIRDLSKKNKNGYDLFLSFLKKSIIKGEPHKSSIYWIFDIERDKVKISGAKENSSQQDMVKAMIVELYNSVVKEIYYEIIDKIDNEKTITIDNASRIISYIEKNILNIPLSKDMIEDIYKYIFEKKITEIKQTDILVNDVLFGLEGDTIALPEYKQDIKNKINKITIDLTNVDESGKLIEVETINGVCQHNITWDNIHMTRQTNYSEFMKQLYNFIQQYVIENTNQEFICKSCGYYLDIRKYIQDGAFDDDKGYITFSMPMETNLEDIPEYEKYIFSIKIMDKNIEKIASAVGISYFIGNTTTVKWRRKGVIKNAIDMVTQNNQLLSKVFKERNENKTKLYGVSKSLSNLFIFDMENNIFQVSSKDKDQEQFKMIKRNNIITYILIYIILELNESQISFFTTDKKNLCDIRIFDKIYTSLFGGLRIKRNNTNDTVDITKYKILCYLIYMISCRIAKHRLWASPQTTEKNIQKMIPNIQRYIVHTTVDIINSILENSFEKGVGYIFEVFRVRFYSKLDSVHDGIFKNDDYYAILLEQNKLNFLTARKREHLKTITEFPPFIYNIVKWRIDVPAKIYPPYIVPNESIVPGISNYTNCNDGHYHKWNLSALDNGSPKCVLCGARFQDIKYDKEATDKIIEKYKTERSNLLAHKFCEDGDFHQYIYDSKLNKNICIKCKNADDHQYTLKELEKINKVIDDINLNRRNEYINMKNEYIASSVEEKQYIKSVVDKNQETMNKIINKDNPMKYIDDFIEILQGSIGNEIKGEYPIQLKNNTYIIDHDHNGLDIGVPLIITESDNKIFHKADHPHFKTDVFYYTNKENMRVDVYYDTITRRLLGYKEASKDYVNINKTDKKIKINYSIYNKLKLMGYMGEFINIDDEYKEIKNKYIDQKDKHQQMYKEIITDISRIRIDNLKKTILEFQRIFNKIVNQYNDKNEQEQIQEDEKINEKYNEKFNKFGYEKEIKNYFADKMNSLIEKYKKKLKNVKTYDSNGKHKVFKHWKAITRGIYMDNFEDNYFNFNTDLIETNSINKYDQQSNRILFYLVNEFTELLKYNQNNTFMKTNICNFLVEFIDRIFFRYNTEHLHTNSDIKRFMYILGSIGFLKETYEQTKSEMDGFYEEYVDMDEEKTEEDIENEIDAEEESEARDLDMDSEDIEEGTESAYDLQNDIDAQFESGY